MTRKCDIKNIARGWLLVGALSGCGGGSAPDIPSSSTSAAAMPILQAVVTEIAGNRINGEAYWPRGSTGIGGRGREIAGVPCLTNEDYHLHSHLTIIVDGKLLAVPADVGLQGCAYELHTHDMSGIIHLEAAGERRYTLGQFFAVWGQPLRATDVAGLRSNEFNVFVQDGAVLTRYAGDLAAIELQAHRNIFLVLGKVPAQLPNYRWTQGL